MARVVDDSGMVRSHDDCGRRATRRERGRQRRPARSACAASALKGMKPSDKPSSSVVKRRRIASGHAVAARPARPGRGDPAFERNLTSSPAGSDRKLSQATIRTARSAERRGHARAVLRLPRRAPGSLQHSARQGADRLPPQDRRPDSRENRMEPARSGSREASSNRFLAALGGLVHTALECSRRLSWRGAAGIQADRPLQHREVVQAIRGRAPERARERIAELLRDSVGDVRECLRPRDGANGPATSGEWPTSREIRDVRPQTR